MKNNQLHLLAAVMAGKGITHVVVSPGSRNAPAIVVFNRQPGLTLYSISDERSAGFYALGMAQQLNRPVALLCTSGSAALNYAPAIVEAFYQKVPLLIITADRPEAWIDQGDSQTIRQRNVFSGYVRKSYHLPDSIAQPDDHRFFERSVSEAIDRTIFPASGPVHLNLPLSEPLYDIEWPAEAVQISSPGIVSITNRVDETEMLRIAEIWNSSVSKMILAGQMNPDAEINHLLEQLADDSSVTLLTETTSNVTIPSAISCIDRTIEAMDVNETDDFKPTVLLTIGGAVVSKKIKALLRKMKPLHHWHVNSDTDEFHMDTYQSLTLTIPSDTCTFLSQLFEKRKRVESHFRLLWLNRSNKCAAKHQQFLRSAPFSDLSVYQTLFREMPADGHLHLGNSTPVRYAQLFDEASQFISWSNRGTSGIDGCVSTAAGASAICHKPLTVITGDVGFFYDSNALWNSNLSPDLRIILINNGGGNIFRVIPGPDNFEELEPFIETAHNLNVEGIVRNFGLKYYKAQNIEEIDKVLPGFYMMQENNKPALLEIFTPNKLSAAVLKDYFKFIAS
jgi:2-succinyl-5-enolpyruvyl-6-hydroxy-3-cyclohexene-1-carboxylate synthase